jgi:hypothetical protein
MSDRFLEIVNELKVTLPSRQKICLECRESVQGKTTRSSVSDQYIHCRFPPFARSIIQSLRDEHPFKLILHQYCAKIAIMPGAAESTKQKMTYSIAWASINREPEILKMENYKHYLSENSKKIVE